MAGAITRGDLVTIAVSGDYGKPRPALVVQSGLFGEHPSVTVLPLTSDLRDAPMLRITVAANGGNGLRVPSQVMVDKAVTVPRGKLAPPIGRLDSATLALVDFALARFLGVG